jgi:hypothetical protein
MSPERPYKEPELPAVDFSTLIFRLSGLIVDYLVRSIVAHLRKIIVVHPVD